MKTPISVKIKMYRVGELGDCFLLSFTQSSKRSHVLIDCGSFRNGADSRKRLKEVVADISKQLKGEPLNLVVGTHQHNDHVSGFVHCKSDFESMQIEQVWLSWLDNPRSSTAREIGDEHGNLRSSVADISKSLKGMKGNKKAGDIAAQLDEVLGFYGASAAPQLPAEGYQNLKAFGKKECRYMEPGKVEPLPGMDGGAVKIYVLGPPRDKKLLYDDKPNKSESYDPHLSEALAMSKTLLSAIKNYHNNVDREEEQFPFNNTYKLTDAAMRKLVFKDEKGTLKNIQKDYYRKAGEDWRTIDNDWLEQAARLALYLDTFTNNSSLVLAFELVQSGKVLLFAADAQTGNWNSWFDVKFENNSSVTTEDLLSRTVVYKVGHHGSHNATLVRGLEAMTHENLIAMIPVDKTDQNITKEKGWKMPATNLYKRLVEVTKNRVLRMDDTYGKGCNPVAEPAKSSWKKSGAKVTSKPLYVEVEIKG